MCPAWLELLGVYHFTKIPRKKILSITFTFYELAVPQKIVYQLKLNNTLFITSFNQNCVIYSQMFCDIINRDYQTADISLGVVADVLLLF